MFEIQYLSIPVVQYIMIRFNFVTLLKFVMYRNKSLTIFKKRQFTVFYMEVTCGHNQRLPRKPTDYVRFMYKTTTSYNIDNNVVRT